MGRARKMNPTEPGIRTWHMERSSGAFRQTHYHTLVLTPHLPSFLAPLGHPQSCLGKVARHPHLEGLIWEWFYKLFCLQLKRPQPGRHRCLEMLSIMTVSAPRIVARASNCGVHAFWPREDLVDMATIHQNSCTEKKRMFSWSPWGSCVGNLSLPNSNKRR